MNVTPSRQVLPMVPRRLRRSHRTLLLLAVGCIACLWPRPTYAACGALDLGACVDAAQYSVYYGLAGIGWSIDRTLLQLVLQLDQFRAYLVTNAFTSAYQALAVFLTPVYAPIATVALILACVLFMLVPLTGNLRIASIRHVLIWIVLTPVLLTVGGQLVGQAEQTRAQIGGALFAQAASGTPGALFGTSASDMPAPTPLYPANPCGTGTLARPAGTALQMDDLAAALLYANAQDIHCPDRGGPSPDIPDAFYATPPGYAFDGYVGNLDSEVERTAAIEGMQRGVTRLFQGILPCVLAVVAALVNLLFALSLLVLWIGIPLGLVFVYLQHTAAGVTGLFRRAVSVFQVSWACSLLLGLLFACLLSAARLGNATAYTGFAIGALLLTLYVSFVAGKTLVGSILTLNATVQSATGLSVTEPIEVAAAAGFVTAGVATGGVALAAAGFAGSEQTASNRYALAAMAGRLPGMAQLGEVAVTMGWLDSAGLTASGLHAGERSLHSWRSMRLQMERDAARFSEESAPASSTAASTPAQRAPVMTESAPPASDAARRLILAAELAAARRDPGVRASALHLDDQQQVISTERASEPALVALRATTIPHAKANIPGLLLDGYHVQENPELGTVSYWRPGTPAESTTATTPTANAPAGSGAASAVDASTNPPAGATATPSDGQPSRGPETPEGTTAPQQAVQPPQHPSEEVAAAPHEPPLAPAPQSLARNQRLLTRLDAEIARTEQALAELADADDAASLQEHGQLAHTLLRLRRARTTVAHRVEQLEAEPSVLPEETSQ